MVKQREKSRGKKGTCLKQICIYMYIYIRTQDNTHGVSFVSASPFVSTPLMVLYRKSAKNTHRCFCFQLPQRKKANDRAEFLLFYFICVSFLFPFFSPSSPSFSVSRRPNNRGSQTTFEEILWWILFIYYYYFHFVICGVCSPYSSAKKKKKPRTFSLPSLFAFK